jgi:adenylate cyclase
MRPPPIHLSDISRCFQGVVPSIVTTADAGMIPNVTYVSQVHLVDERHVALSRQFFNKTSRNLDATRRASAEVYDPLTFEAYRLQLRFLRSETGGALFVRMALRIDAIASLTGMAGVFRLIAADLFEVERVEKVEEFLVPPLPGMTTTVSLDGPRTEMRGLQWISEQINRAESLESLIESVLSALESYFGFSHSMLLLHEEGERLVTVASRGYGQSGVGAEVRVGDGLIGTVARERRLLRMTGLKSGLSYGRAARRTTEETGRTLAPEIPLPGLPDAQSALIIPLWVGERLIGVLAVESRDSLGFAEWHEAYLEIIGNQIALGIERELLRAVEADDASPSLVADTPSLPIAAKPRRRVDYYAADECLFIDDQYLIRNVPAKILWRLLSSWKQEGRLEFSNRELRLDPTLGLPEFRDNLESRLILLRRRLEEKKLDVRIVPSGRGRFLLSIDADLELVEK